MKISTPTAEAEAEWQKSLADFAKANSFTSSKGPLCVALVINETVKTLKHPIDPNSLLTDQGGQVLGLGRGAVQAILGRERHGITRVLAEEGGRTSRGSIARMRAYVEFINGRRDAGHHVDLESAEYFWVQKVRDFFAGKPFVLKLDTSWSVRAAVRQLLGQAFNRQKDSSGTRYVGTMMQHLVGAKLTVCLGDTETLQHNSANASDQRPGRHGDFDIGDVAVHVTTSPSEALIQKCQENLAHSKRPLIITLPRGVTMAEGLLDNAAISDRVDVIEFEQFVATNVFEIGQFRAEGRTETILRIIDTYNEIIEEHESDPSLRIEQAKGK
ncbi:MAG TPA: DUF4928 domain-containing protein [Xanthomonadaceae bacterium]|jgi:hypothetical protein|nr:DUF4928 domain-containing protein [Xanthomonadaceae bacterium]